MKFIADDRRRQSRIGRFLDKSRLIVYLEVDCFDYSGHWPRFRRQHPCAVLCGKRLVSLNSEAIALGATEGMTRHQARRCRGLILANKTDDYIVGGKGDEIVNQSTNKFRNTIGQYCNDNNYVSVIEWSSSTATSLYMDLTEMTNDFVTNYDNIYYADTIQTGRALVEGPEHRYLFVDNNQGLVRNVGKNRMTKALDFVNGMRRSILAETGHECSAGISYNKFLAKLAARLNRPIETTVLVNTGGIGRVFRELTVDDVCSDNNEMIGCGDDGNGGGGQELAKRIKSELGVRRWSELLEFSSEELAAIDGQSSSTANKLWQMARGIDDRPVVGENFPTN